MCTISLKMERLSLSGFAVMPSIPTSINSKEVLSRNFALRKNNNMSCNKWGRYQLRVKNRVHFDLETKLLQILANGPQDRGELCRRLALPRTTIYDYLKKMELCGLLIKEVRKQRNKGRHVRGRPKVLWRLNGYERTQKTPNTYLGTPR